MSKTQQPPIDDLSSYFLDFDAIEKLDLHSPEFQEKLNKVLEENRRIEEASQVDHSKLNFRIGK